MEISALPTLLIGQMRVEVETDLVRRFGPLLPEVIRGTNDDDTRNHISLQMVMGNAESKASFTRARRRHGKKVWTLMSQETVEGTFLPWTQFDCPSLQG